MNLSARLMTNYRGFISCDDRTKKGVSKMHKSSFELAPTRNFKGFDSKDQGAVWIIDNSQTSRLAKTSLNLGTMIGNNNLELEFFKFCANSTPIFLVEGREGSGKTRIIKEVEFLCCENGKRYMFG